MRLVQEQKASNAVWFSSNTKPSARCPRHSDSPSRTNPLFFCAWCGNEFCPGCCGRAWLEFADGQDRVLWYRCPYCPIGLAFVMFPKSDSFSAQTPAEEPKGSKLTPVIVRRGVYEAWQDGSGTCLLIVDGKDRYAWIQKPDAIHLKAAPAEARVEASLFPAERGTYLLVDRNYDEAAEGSGLFLYLQLPHGYQEYRLPQGWPEGEEVKRLETTSRILKDQQVEQLLAQESCSSTAASRLKVGSPTSVQFQTRAA
jgi:hypothetical protein